MVVHNTKHIRPEIQKFKSFLVSHFGKQFSGLVLFGSHARNQARPDSDVDLLLILKEKSPKNEEYIDVLPMISNFLLETGMLLSLIIKTESELENQKEGLLKTISSEGIRI
jgi:predicted nucleotidyltransferase